MKEDALLLDEGGQQEEIDYEKLLRECPEIGRELAKKYIKQFFHQEQYHSGGEIPESILLSDKNVNMVVELNICDGVKKAYQLLSGSREPIPHLPEESDEIKIIEDSSEELPEDEPILDDGLFPPDVQLIIGLMHRCKRREIPQPFVAGIFCIYLEVCAGIQLPSFSDE